MPKRIAIAGLAAHNTLRARLPAAVVQGEHPELLTVKEAAARLNVSVDCVYQMVEAAKLPVGKRGIRINAADLAPPVVRLADLIR